MAITRAGSASALASGLEGVPQLLVSPDVSHVEELGQLQHTVPEMFDVSVLADLAATPADETFSHVILVDVVYNLLQSLKRAKVLGDLKGLGNRRYLNERKFFPKWGKVRFYLRWIQAVHS